MATSNIKRCQEKIIEFSQELEIDLLGSALKNGLLILTMLFASAHVTASESWSCKKTAHYSIYEDIERSESQMTEKARKLEWIDKDTIGFESFTHSRTSPT